jgi:hypothetical protein
MTLNASGNLALGTTSPTGLFTSYKSQNGDPKLGHFYNDNTGTAAEAAVYITNSSSVADGLFLQTYGQNGTTAGGFVQDASIIGSGSGASGGLSIMTRANADMRFYTNGHTNERMRIDSSGNLGLGCVPSSGVRLDIRSNAAATLGDFRNASSTGYGLYVAAGDTDSQYAFRAADYQNNSLVTITGAGKLLVGTTTVPSGGTNRKAVFKGNDSLGLQGGTGTSTGDIGFYNPSGSEYWSIASNQTNWYIADADFTHYAVLGQNMGSWAFGSDRRLKENIVDISYGLDSVMAMQPRAFTFTSSGVETIGFVAQELAEVIPEAVTGTAVEYSDADTPQEKASKSLGVSKDTLIPVLVKAIQELKEELNAATARITEMENT